MSNELSYAFGNCTYFVAKTLPWIPGGLGDAYQWIANAKAKGLQVSNTPVVGSVVVYGQGNGYSQFGHVAVVQSLNSDGTFNVSEMNFAGFNQTDTRTSSMKDVAGFILPPGTTSSQNVPTFNPPSLNPIDALIQSVTSAGTGLEKYIAQGAFITLGIFVVLLGLVVLIVGDFKKPLAKALNTIPAVEVATNA